MNWNILIIIVLLVINFPVYKFIFRLFFYDSDEFDESVRYSFTPNIISFFRGEYWQDKFSTMRLNFFIFICIMTVILEFYLINKIVDYFQ